MPTGSVIKNNSVFNLPNIKEPSDCSNWPTTSISQAISSWTTSIFILPPKKSTTSSRNSWTKKNSTLTKLTTSHSTSTTRSGSACTRLLLTMPTTEFTWGTWTRFFSKSTQTTMWFTWMMHQLMGQESTWRSTWLRTKFLHLCTQSSKIKWVWREVIIFTSQGIIIVSQEKLWFW